jgi:hypothetical protein
MLAVEELSRERYLMSPAHANREVYQLLKEGVKVTYRDAEGVETVETVYLIDWQNPPTTISSWPPNSGSRASCTNAGRTCSVLSTASRWSSLS